MINCFSTYQSALLALQRRLVGAANVYKKNIFVHFYDTGGWGAHSFAGEMVGTQFYEGERHCGTLYALCRVQCPQRRHTAGCASCVGRSKTVCTLLQISVHARGGSFREIVLGRLCLAASGLCNLDIRFINYIFLVTLSYSFSSLCNRLLQRFALQLCNLKIFHSPYG